MSSPGGLRRGGACVSVGRGQRSWVPPQSGAHTVTAEAGSLSISPHSNAEEGVAGEETKLLRSRQRDCCRHAVYKQMGKGAKAGLYPEAFCVREKG